METAKCPPATNPGFSVIERGLSGLSDFSRSLNLSVLANDPSLREAYAAAVAEGELPTHRARVLILGEPRAGKTSLLNRLMGREFDDRELPTEGIETHMCRVTDVDHRWVECEGVDASDIRDCASAAAVMGEAPSDVRNGQDVTGDETLTGPASGPAAPGPVAASSVDAMRFATQLGLLVGVVFTLGMFRYGYVMFVWCSVASLALMLDYNNAYRFATSVSLFCALFEAMVRTDRPLEVLACKDNGGGESWMTSLGFIAKSIFFNVLNTAVIGVSNGLGFRTGIAVAFSAGVHPAETSLTPTTALRGLKASWDMLPVTVVFLVGAILGFGCYKYCMPDGRLHRIRVAICCGFMTVLLGVLLEGTCRYRPYLFLALSGFVMGLLGSWGVMLGRRAVLKYGFEASYVTKKCAGFVLGLYLLHACGWSLRIPGSSVTSVTFYIVSLTAHPLFDLHTTYKIWKAKRAYPIKVIRDKMKAAVKGQPLLETKLSLWDFAGDSLYHSAHHVFMPDRALYVIVFNLRAAIADENGQLLRLLFWLHSVCAHARHPDAVVIIVGTHRASVSEADASRFAEELHRRIAAPFCHRLVLNPVVDRPLFLVENSQPDDESLQRLRAEIHRRVESAKYARERYPIRYRRFYREIQNRRKQAETECSAYVMSLDQFSDLARDTCDVTSEDDSKSMLRYFVESGEIIHRDDDDVTRQHVVLDPQFLVDVMRKLVRIPRGSERSHRYAVDWRDYESSGIISGGLLRHIYGDMSHLVPLLTKLLQAYDLLCPVASVSIPNCPQTSFLVPAMLPSFQGESVTFWTPQSNEEVFYFDFGLFDPRTVYYRLLTRCLTRASLDHLASQPLIFADRCRFHIGTSFVFKLQLERQSSQQILLSVTTLAFEKQHPVWKLLKFLLNAVKRITARDYPHLRFAFGPRCPYCVCDPGPGSPRDDIPVDTCGNNNGDEAHVHVLKMAGSDRPFPATSPVVMLCGQKRYEYVISGYESVDWNCGPCHPRRVTFTKRTLITKLPPDLFQKVCTLLNISSGPRNWKTLADELGKDIESVAVLDSQRTTNPTGCLLQEWAMTGGHVTVNDLLEVLGRPSLQRIDVIQEIRQQMAQE